MSREKPRNLNIKKVDGHNQATILTFSRNPGNGGIPPRFKNLSQIAV